MIATLLEPFEYNYMTNAILVSALVGGVCAFLSAFLILRGWSLIGDALSHSVVPGVAAAYMIGLPFSLGAFVAGGLAAASMLFLSERSGLRIDVIIGIIFTAFFGIGLFMISLSPIPIDVQGITMGNILTITTGDTLQLLVIGFVTLFILSLTWRDLFLVFFDEFYARSIGIPTRFYKILFFTLLSASTVAALQTVGALLVVAMVITPGATAYLIHDRFERLIITAVFIGTFTSFIGAYLSYYLDGATGGIIVVLETLVFLFVYFLAPKYGYFANKRRARLNTGIQNKIRKEDHA